MATRKPRRIVWVSAGAASAVTALLTPKADVYAYCDTGSEDADNARFLGDLEGALGATITRLRSAVFRDTWDVWERKQYLAGLAGAPCTNALKRLPRLAFQRDDDDHAFGYTADERARAKRMADSWAPRRPSFPLIDLGITKAACLAILADKGLKPPRMYSLGYDHSNCVPCPKATSPRYWSLVRQTHPTEFARMAALSRKLGVRLARLNGQRVFIDDVPQDHPVSDPITPDCDLLCQLSASQ